MNIGLSNFLKNEEVRLCRLKIFCEAAQLNFRAASEGIAEICNRYLISPDEVQRRFIYSKNHNINTPIGHPMFWDLAAWEEERKFRTADSQI
jgi:hypothetical protein